MVANLWPFPLESSKKNAGVVIVGFCFILLPELAQYVGV